jgi:hypothetical protein
VTAVPARFSKPSFVLSAALCGMVATTFPITVFSLALPQLEHEFSASLDTVTWVPHRAAPDVRHSTSRAGPC